MDFTKFHPDDWLCPTFGISLLVGFIWLVIDLIRSKFRRRGLSRTDLLCECGYELTGNTSGTCPECGTPFSSKPVPTKDPNVLN